MDKTLEEQTEEDCRGRFRGIELEGKLLCENKLRCSSVYYVENRKYCSYETLFDNGYLKKNGEG